MAQTTALIHQNFHVQLGAPLPTLAQVEGEEAYEGAATAVTYCCCTVSSTPF